MSSRKPITPKMNQSRMSVKPNMNTTRRTKLDSTTVSTATGVSTYTPPERSTQHKIDIMYSKYLQCVGINRLLAKKNAELEQSIDEQLTFHGENLQNKIDETEALKSRIKFAKDYKELVTQLLFLDDTLKNKLTDLSNTDQIQVLTQKLQTVCNKLYLDGMRLDSSDEGYQKLNCVSQKLLEVSEEIKLGTNVEYFDFIENVRQIEELSKKIKNVRDNVVKSQKILSKLVLKAASMELSKDEEKTIDSL